MELISKYEYDLKNVLPQKIYEVIERAGITTKDVLMFSIWDLKKITGLTCEDVKLVKDNIANLIKPTIKTAAGLTKLCNEQFVSTGCKNVDTILKGGFKRGTLTEIYGESGVGKTQLALQTTINNWKSGCVYICTEDVFPVKRFEQMKNNLNFEHSSDYGKNVYIEHITDANELLTCISFRLNLLLQKASISLLVIDSVAAPYRSDNTDYIQRANDLRDLATSLFKIAQTYYLAVLCINQVTTPVDDICNSDVKDDVIPSLGLAWSNMVCTRLFLTKTSSVRNNAAVRQLEIIFSPYLANSVCNFSITSSGVI